MSPQPPTAPVPPPVPPLAPAPATFIALLLSIRWQHWLTLFAGTAFVGLTWYLGHGGATVTGAATLAVILHWLGVFLGSPLAEQPIAGQLAARKKARAQERITPVQPPPP